MSTYFSFAVVRQLLMVSGSKMTSRGHRHTAIVTEPAAEACAVLDPATCRVHRIFAGRWRS